MKRLVIFLGILLVLITVIFGIQHFSEFSNNLSASSIKAPSVNSATIQQVSIFQSISKTNSSIKQALNKNDLATLTNLLIQRKDSVKKLAQENAYAVTRVGLGNDIISRLPKNLSDLVEKPIQITGTLNVSHIDNFPLNKEEDIKYTYQIISNAKRYQLYPYTVQVESKSKVAVSGYIVDDILVGAVTSSDNLRTTTTIPTQKKIHKLAVVLVNYLDSTTLQFTPTDAYNEIFNGQFYDFFAEQSYGNVLFQGDVFGWYTLPRQSDTPSCWPSHGNGGELDSYLSTLSLQNYDHLAIIADCPGSGTSGESFVGKIPQTINGQTYQISVASLIGNNFTASASPFSFSWTALDYILSHEMGHSLGLGQHSKAYYCGGAQILSNNCESMEYGNHFDVMGSIAYSLHTNAFQKEKLGWVPAQSIQKITQSGDYTIQNFERTPSGSFSFPQIAEIQVAGTNKKPYYLELRKAYGFDSFLSDPPTAPNLNGLFINHIYHIYGTSVSFPRLLDMQPTGNPNWWQDFTIPVLSGNIVFSDPQTGITIGPILPNPNSIDTIKFHVDINNTTCVSQAPTILNIATQTVNPGSGFALNIPFNNNDYFICPASDFSVNLTLPVGFSSTNNPIMIPQVMPLDEVVDTNGPFINVDGSVVPGIYNINTKVTNMSSGIQSNINTLIIVQ